MFPSFRLNMRALQVCYVFPFMISVFKKRQLHKYGALSPVQSRHSKSNNKSNTFHSPETEHGREHVLIISRRCTVLNKSTIRI
ncbi:hypothetical protein AXX17_AT4G27810 [Arabidopsis thaliana]|uniref:Uncharacterized protein n=1 Tax=Arabidopsis thaliana TaxID=3702 RepID=A0A178V3F5_ARATH|nr:hypothetical protein AXX17_AT4G27810 [Arabidopsis thaliana]